MSYLLNFFKVPLKIYMQFAIEHLFKHVLKNRCKNWSDQNLWFKLIKRSQT